MQPHSLLSVPMQPVSHLLYSDMREFSGQTLLTMYPRANERSSRPYNSCSSRNSSKFTCCEKKKNALVEPSCNKQLSRSSCDEKNEDPPRQVVVYKPDEVFGQPVEKQVDSRHCFAASRVGSRSDWRIDECQLWVNFEPARTDPLHCTLYSSASPVTYR